MHRAGGLWPWALLLVFAWSGVALTLYDQVYRPTTSLFLSFHENPLDTVPTRANPAPQPPIGWEPGYHTACQHLEALGENRDLTHPRPGTLRLHPAQERPQTDGAHQPRRERTIRRDLGVRGRHGQALLGHYLPTGEAAGNTVTTWLTSLHIAAVGGVGYRVIATVVGLAVIG